MLILFSKSEQFGLFSAPVHVAGGVRGDGTIVKPHIRIQKIKFKPAAHDRQPSLFDAPAVAHESLDLFAPENVARVEAAPEPTAKPVDKLTAILDKFGGKDGVRKMLLTAPMREASKMLGMISEISGKPLSDVMDEYGSAPTADPVPDSNVIAKPQPVPEPSVARDSNVIAPFGVPAGISKAARRELNAKAAAIVNSGKDITDADRAILRQYSGNGGCGDSLNEFYTDPEVATAMWTMLGKLGVTSGAVLEPSCATGVFAHTAPAGIRITGVEMDPTSAAIAEVLHGDRHEIVNSSLERFATSDGERQFDAVIGNAPFGLRGSLIKDDKPELKTAEGYFLDTSLDKCKAGGMVAMIVPTGVMDSKSARTVRQRLLCKGEFLGAVRMPNTAFEHSHTEVTTDIMFFRKRPDDVAGALQALPQAALKKLGIWDDEYLSGGYFAGRGAASVFGTMEAGWRAKAGMGNDITVAGSMIGVPESIAAWVPDEFTTAAPSVPDILAAVSGDDALTKKVAAGAIKRAYVAGKVGDTKTVDGIEYILQGKPPRWHRVDEFLQSSDVTDAQQLARDIESAINGGDRAGLADRVRAYIDAHGNPGKNKNLLVAASQDRVLYRLIGAVSADGELSDVVADRAGRRVEGSLDIAAQSLALEHEGSFTVAQLAERMDKPPESLEDHLFASSAYAYAGDGRWAPMDQYLTGELWPKLDALRAAVAQGDLREGLAEKYELQIKRLEDAIDPKSLEDVDMAINSAFLPLNVIEAYFNEKKNASPNEWERKQQDMSIKFADSWYTITGGSYGSKLIADYLNRDGVKKDDLPKIDEMNAEFKEWLLGSRYRDQVEDLYNRKFRGFVQQVYSDETIAIPGMNTEGLKQYQYGGLRWALAAGKGIIAADVGLGKTVRGLMLARMAKINGTAKRPTFIVPKSVLANWVAEAERWFPGSRVLVVGETYTRDKDGNLKSKPDTAEERNRKLHDMTQNDYDFVFISQPSFNDIDLDPITKGQYVNDDFWVQRGDKKGNAGDKRLRKIREAYDQAIANREFQKRSDAIYWNDLGVDMMIVDEGQNFKNLYAAKNRFGEALKFLGGQGQSNRAFDMNMKARYLREHNGGNGMYMLSATPTKNSPLEIYSMLSHIAPEAFENIGIRNSEEFLDRFCVFVNDKILSTTGAIEDALVTSGFKNLGELREIMRRYIDRKTAADVGLVMPARDDQMHMVDMSPTQQSVYAGLRQDMIDSATKKDATGDSHIFSIMSKMGKASLDLEILDPEAYAGEVSPKYQDAATRIIEGAKDGGQVVFSDSVKSHQKIADALVAAGMDRKRIAIINADEAESSSKRQNIADAFNVGKLDAVIGNTACMGEGMNLQKRTTDVHHFDLPWDPASMQQRNGRGLRQGNINESVRIHTYMSKGSFDGYRYQSMMAKKDWQDMLWTGGDTIDNLAREGKFDRADLLIMMSADPEAERAKFEADKSIASQRYDADQRKEVAVEFKRLQLMKQSFGALKNKDTGSAARLRSKLENAKTKLAANKYFIAKSALDSKTPVVIHPETGAALMTGVGLDIAENDGTVGKWVISSVNPISGDVSMRRYGQLGAGARAITVPLAKMETGVTTFDYKEADEHAAIAAKLHSDAEASVGQVADLKSLRDMPSGVINANYRALQDRLKQGLRDYKWSAPYGGMGFIDEAGVPVAAESHEASKRAATHDLMLPTAEHREKAIAAYVADEQAKRFTTEYVTARRGKSESKFVQKMPGKYGNRTNQWGGIGKEIFGADFHKEAHSAFERIQGEAVRHAKTFPDALAAAAPMADLAYGSVPKWPRRALALLYAKAKHSGDLSKPFDTVQPKETTYGREVNALHKELWSYRKYDGANPENASSGGWVDGRQTSGSVRDTLARLAQYNGYHDLAAAITVGSMTKQSAENDLYRIVDMKHSDPHVVAAINHILAKYPELGKTTVPYSVSSKFGGSAVKTMADLARKLNDKEPA